MSLCKPGKVYNNSLRINTYYWQDAPAHTIFWSKLQKIFGVSKTLRNYLSRSLLFLLFSKQQKCPLISLNILLTFPEHYIGYSKLLVAGPNFYTHLCCQWDNCEILISVVFGQRGANDSKLHVTVVLIILQQN